jgi:S-formylglutathione hydrolase FrmB
MSSPNTALGRSLRTKPSICFCFAFLSVLFLPSHGFAESRVESRAIQSRILGRSVRYTVLLPPSYDAAKTRRYPVLYYLHGLGDDDQTLVNSGGWDLVEDLQKRREIGEFLIVTPAAGSTFYINSKDGKVRYEDFFLKELIPQVEQRYRITAARGARGIGGTSMGGYGALRLAFGHPELFAAVTAHMPALAESLPEGLSGPGLSAFGRPFDNQFWKQNTPFTVLPQRSALNGLKIYFDCGRQDDYGFNVGSEALHVLLQKRGIPHEFHLYPGRHSGEYVAQHFPESLRFQSSALNAK